MLTTHFWNVKVGKRSLPARYCVKLDKSPDILVLAGHVDGSPASRIHRMDPTAETIRRRIQGCQKPRK